MELPEAPWVDAQALEVHAGWREDLGDARLRVAAGASYRWGALGAELHVGARLGEEGEAYLGQVVVARTLPTDGGQFIFRDESVTVAGLFTVAPWSAWGVGPELALGPEIGWMAYRSYDNTVDAAVPRVEEEPFPTAGVLTRIGVGARFGRVGARATLGAWTGVLREPDFEGGRGEPAIVGEWRSGIDLLVRLR